MSRLRLWVLCILLSLPVSAALAGDVMRVHFINVGQGDATLFEFANGAILVDTGGEQNNEFSSDDALVDYLEGFFADRPDLGGRLTSLIITHPHIDHTRGIDDVLVHFTPFNAVTNGLEKGSGRFDQRRLHREISRREGTPDPSDDIEFVSVKLESIPAMGLTNSIIDPVSGDVDPVITVLWGAVAQDPGWGKDHGKLNFDNPNNHSVVVRVDFGEASVLLTGDLEEPAIKSLLARYAGTSELDVDVYQAGHHGSVNGTTQALVTAMSPEYAVLSMGPFDRETAWTAWAYGHPRKEAVELLESAITKTRTPEEVEVGIGSKSFEPKTISDAIYATGWDGTVVFEATEDGQWKIVQPAPSQAPQPALVNINTASFEELVSLPMIGPSRAQAILEHRAQHGNFSSIDELDNVRGIGPATIQAIRPYVTVSGTP